MTKTVSISDFLPTISSEHKRNISELVEWHNEYIDGILEYSDYSFADYLKHQKMGELGDLYNQLDEMGIGLGYSGKTEIIGCRELAANETDKRPEYAFFVIEI